MSPGAASVTSEHGRSAIGERRGSRRGRGGSARWAERVAGLALGVALGSGWLASCASSPARAQGAGSSPSTAPSGAADDRAAAERADAAFEAGRALFDLGRYEQACEKFELSQELDPSPGTALNLGNCYEPQGDLVRALENFERAFADAQRTSDARRKELWTDAARERIASLSPRVPQLRLHGVPPDGRVSIDHHPLAQASGTLRINPGRHRVEVSAPGKRSFRQDIELAVGQRLALDVPALEAARGSPESARQGHYDPGREGAADGEGYGPWPYVLGGAGAVLLATSVGTGLAANAKENELENECIGTECPPELEATRDGAKTLAVVTDVFWITGLIAAGAGVTLFVLDAQDDTASTSVEAGCFGSGCGLIANGRF